MADKSYEELAKENKEYESQLKHVKELSKYSDKDKKDRANRAKDRKNAQAALKSLNYTLNQLCMNSDNLARTTGEYLKAWVSWKSFDGFDVMVKSLVASNNNFHRLIVNAGSANISLKEATKNVTDLQVELGAAFEDAQNVVGVLASKQFVGNLKEAAEGAYSLARASGIDKAAAAELTVQFQKTGKLATQTINGIYADILKIQQTNGLTKDGLTAVSNQIVKMAGNMRAFGQSEQQIRKMAAGATQLVSALEKVGVSAQKANEWIDKLTDPERIEENIGLYAQLGMSVSDALSGNFDTTQMQNGLKDFGEKVKAMGPIAGSAYAKAFGMSFNNAVKAADMEETVGDQLTPEEKALDAIKELTENTKTNTEKMTDSINKFIGKVMSLGPVMLTVIGLVGTILMSKIRDSIAEGINKANKEGEESSKKTADEILKYNKGTYKDRVEAYKKAQEKLNKISREELENNRIKEEENIAYLKKEQESAQEVLNKLKLESYKNLSEAERTENVKNQNEYMAFLENLNKDIDAAEQRTTNITNEILKLQDEQANQDKIKIELGLDRDAKLDGRKFTEKLSDFAKDGGALLGTKAASIFKTKAVEVGHAVAGPFKKAGSFVGNAVSKSFIGKAARGLKGAGNAIVGGLKFAGGFVSELFKRSIKEGGKDAAKSMKKGGKGSSSVPGKSGGKLAGMAKIFGKIAAVGGIIIMLLSPLIAAIKDMSSVKNVMQNFQDSIKNLVKDLGPTIDTLAAVGNQILSSITGLLSKVMKAIGGFLEKMAPAIALVADILGQLLDSVGEVLVNVLPLIAAALNAIMLVVAPALLLLKLPLKIISWALTWLMKPITLLNNILTGILNIFGKGKLEKAQEAMENNTEALEKATEPQGEQISVGADGGMYSSGLNGGTTTTSVEASAGATTANSTTQSSTSRTNSSLENKLDELNGTVKKLIDIESRKLGGGEMVDTLGNKVKDGLGSLKEGAPLRIRIEEMSTLAALQMQGGIIGLGASAISLSKDLFNSLSAADVDGETRP